MSQRRSKGIGAPRFDPINEALQAIPSAMRRRMWAALPVEMQHIPRRVELLLAHSRAGALPKDRHQRLMAMARLEYTLPDSPMTPYKLADAVLGPPPDADEDGDIHVEVVLGERVTREVALRSLAEAYSKQREALLAAVEEVEAAARVGEAVIERLLASPEGRAFADQAARRVQALPPGVAARMRRMPVVTPSAEAVQAVLSGVRVGLRKARKPPG